MNPRSIRARQAGGFTLLEVLVAIIVLAFGLLGFALLQTMNVRFVQSANYRTQATNLAYDLTERLHRTREPHHDEKEELTKVRPPSDAGDTVEKQP